MKALQKNKQSVYCYFTNTIGETLQNLQNIKLLHSYTVNGFVLK